MRNAHKHHIVRLMMSVCIAAPSGALAQLDEITVTAQRKEESIQETPVAVAAYSPEDLRVLQIESLDDLGAVSPSLNVAFFPTNRNNLTLFIRGIGNADSNVLTRDPAVGLYIDDVYLGRTTGLLSDIIDLERIEVLRGPQGALFGRNATGGAVRLISAEPTGEFGVRQEFAYGNFDHVRSLTSVDLPAIGAFSAKASLLYRKQDGWVDNDGPNRIAGGEYNDFFAEDSWGVRVAAKYEPNDRFKLLYSFDYSDMETTPSYNQLNPREESRAQAETPLPPLLPGAVTFPNRLRETRDPFTGERFAYLLPPTTTITSGHHLTAEYALSDNLTVKSITAYRRFEDDNSQSFAQSFLNIVDLGFPGCTPCSVPGNFETAIFTQQEQFSQEVQLLGDAFDGALDWILGANFFGEDSQQLETQYLDRTTAELLNDPVFILDSFAPPFRIPNLLGNTLVTTDNRTTAVFGQANYSPKQLPGVTLSVGGRFSWETRGAVRGGFGNPAFTNPSFGPGENTIKATEFDPTVSLSYAVSDGINVYARYAEGHRAGGSGTRDFDFSRTFDPERVKSYEIGLKTTFWDNRVRANVAAFMSRFSDLILDFIPDPANPQIIAVTNAGRGEINGVELELDVAPTDYLTFSTGYTFLDAEITEATDPFTGADATGLIRFPWAPKHAINAAVDLVLPDIGLGAPLLHFDYTYQSEQLALANVAAQGPIIVPGFGLANGQLIFAEMTELPVPAQFSLWARNIFDNEAVNYVVSNTADVYTQPRTFGFRVRLVY